MDNLTANEKLAIFEEMPLLSKPPDSHTTVEFAESPTIVSKFALHVGDKLCTATLVPYEEPVNCICREFVVALMARMEDLP